MAGRAVTPTPGITEQRAAHVAPPRYCFTLQNIAFYLRALDGRIQNSRGFGLYACSHAPCHVIRLMSRGARRQKRIHTRLYKLKRDYVAAVATNMPCLFNASVL